jgi:hypothetical protein
MNGMVTVSRIVTAGSRVAAAAAVGAGVWLGYELLIQNGRLVSRIEALERQLAQMTGRSAGCGGLAGGPPAVKPDAIQELAASHGHGRADIPAWPLDVGKFSVDWFTHNVPVWQTHLTRFKGTPCTALEIGAFEGRATRWLLENVLTHPKSRFHVVDTFGGSDGYDDRSYYAQNFTDTQQRFRVNVAPYAESVSVHHGMSVEELPRLCDLRVDIVYVDGGHLAADTLYDAVTCWHMLNTGGVMIFDDYEWTGFAGLLAGNHVTLAGCQPVQRTPKPAIDAFLLCYQDQLKVLHKQYQVVVEKR